MKERYQSGHENGLVGSWRDETAHPQPRFDHVRQRYHRAFRGGDIGGCLVVLAEPKNSWLWTEVAESRV